MPHRNASTHPSQIDANSLQKALGGTLRACQDPAIQSLCGDWLHPHTANADELVSQAFRWLVYHYRDNAVINEDTLVIFDRLRQLDRQELSQLIPGQDTLATLPAFESNPAATGHKFNRGQIIEGASWLGISETFFTSCFEGILPQNCEPVAYLTPLLGELGTQFKAEGDPQPWEKAKQELLEAASLVKRLGSDSLTANVYNRTTFLHGERLRKQQQQQNITHLLQQWQQHEFQGGPAQHNAPAYHHLPQHGQLAAQQVHPYGHQLQHPAPMSQGQHLRPEQAEGVRGRPVEGQRPGARDRTRRSISRLREAFSGLVRRS